MADLSDDKFQTAFWATKRAMADAAEAAFAEHGVRSGQQFILQALWEQDGVTPVEIARRYGLATPTITKAVGRMEAAGLVLRKPNPTDARSVRVFLTARGRKLRQSIAIARRQLTERALSTLNHEARAQLVQWLEEIRANLSGAGDET